MCLVSDVCMVGVAGVFCVRVSGAIQFIMSGKHKSSQSARTQHATETSRSSGSVHARDLSRPRLTHEIETGTQVFYECVLLGPMCVRVLDSYAVSSNVDAASTGYFLLQLDKAWGSANSRKVL